MREKNNVLIQKIPNDFDRPLRTDISSDVYHGLRLGC